MMVVEFPNILKEEVNKLSQHLLLKRMQQFSVGWSQ